MGNGGKCQYILDQLLPYAAVVLITPLNLVNERPVKFKLTGRLLRPPHVARSIPSLNTLRSPTHIAHIEENLLGFRMRGCQLR